MNFQLVYQRFKENNVHLLVHTFRIPSIGQQIRRLVRFFEFHIYIFMRQFTSHRSFRSCRGLHGARCSPVSVGSSADCRMYPRRSKRGKIKADDSDDSDAEFLDIIKGNPELVARYSAELRSRKISTGMKSQQREEKSKDINKSQKLKDLNSLVNINDVSLPKLKKAIHKVMKKRYGNKFFKKGDWVTETLDRLNIEDTVGSRRKVAFHIKNWIECKKSIEDKKPDVDSKKGILDEKVLLTEDTSVSLQDKKNLKVSEENHEEEQEENEVFLIIPPAPVSKCIRCRKVLEKYTHCACARKSIPLITIDD